ncbi:MAG TPA: DsbA family protein [Terriglobia bacterium]|nr:DsbA family protein [Terriglobia bacterium]
MDRSNPGKWLAGIAIAILLGFLAGRQQQILNSNREILRQLDELRTSIKSTANTEPAVSQPVERLDLNVRDAAIRGNAGAKVALVEFSDFECPFCGRHARDSYPQLDRDYIRAGKIQYVFRHYPLADIHPRAMKAGEAGECARRQDRFWELHDQLFANQKKLEPASIVGYARTAGLEMKTFETCLAGQAAETVLADLNEGTRAGVTATPTFFLGFTQKDGSVRVVEKIVGAKPYAALQATLERLLATPDVETGGDR